jgi:hypothetical protein
MINVKYIYRNKEMKALAVRFRGSLTSNEFAGRFATTNKHKIDYLKILSVSLFFLFLITGCSTTKILPDKPVTGNLPERPERAISQISLPMEIDISSVEALINQKLPSGQIASDSRRVSNTTSYSYQVFRNRPVTFTAVGNELVFKIPIDIRAQGSYTICAGYWHDGKCCSAPIPFSSNCIPGVTTTEHGNASPSVDIELRVKLEIQEDYSIKANTYLKGALTGDTHLHIDLIGDLIRINIDIMDKLEKPLQKFVQDYQQEIDNKVAELVKRYDIKKEILAYWEKAQEPVKMGDFWLDIQPEKVIFENLNANSEKLKIAVGFASKLQIVSSKPLPSTKPLPDLTLQQGTNGEFNIYLPANTSFELLETQVKNEVTGNKYEKGGISVKIKDIEIKGVELNKTSLLLVKVSVKGQLKFKRFKGDLYFTAIPSVDEENKIVSVEDFKIEPNTNSFLINKGLPILIDNFYYDELKQKMRYSYKDDYEKYFSLLNDKIKEIEIGNLAINGELKELKVPGFFIDSKGIELLLIAKGTLKSTLNIE